MILAFHDTIVNSRPTQTIALRGERLQKVGCHLVGYIYYANSSAQYHTWALGPISVISDIGLSLISEPPI
jgi:hypothetical protein